MKIIRVPAGIYSVNCYIIYSVNNMEGLVIDPGGDADTILKIIEDNKVDVKNIVLTHGHGDHIGAVSTLKQELNVPVYIHEDDLIMLQDADRNLSSSMAIGSIELRPDELLKDGDVIQLGKHKVEVIHTPGHTPGCICLKVDKYLFSGDTLFKASIGRTDLMGGSFDDIINSIKEKLFILDDDVVVLPGHGDTTTILAEKMYNPFLN
ncbi:MAG: MBL fold metallo-hydrolase [Tissierellaceae bacterium]|nr:MBL fold metallo-hydrolase [Tissierellaceae bacterium]